MGIHGMFQVSISFTFWFVNNECGRTISDSYGQGSLTSRANVDQFDNSVETCTSACHGGGFSLAGMVLAQQCCTHFASVSLMSFPLLTNLLFKFVIIRSKMVAI